MNDQDEQKVVARRRRMLLTIYVLAMVAGVGGGLGFAIVHPSDGDRSGSLDPVGALVAVGVAAVVLVVVGWLMARRLRSPEFTRLLSQSRSHRSRVGRALRTGRPIAADDLPMAETVVSTLRPSTRRSVLLVVAVVLQIAAAFTLSGVARWVVLSVAALEALCVVAYGWLVRRVGRNYERALAAHREQGDTRG